VFFGHGGLFEFTVIQSNTNITGKRDGKHNPFITDAEEMIDAAPLETIVDEYEEGDSDIEID